MRIIGGRFGGRRLDTPRSDEIRPMRDQVRSALFNILGNRVEGAYFLDLYAGTGSVGIEALSRGAKHVTFVDKAQQSIKILNNNMAVLRAEDEVEVIKADVFAWLEREIVQTFLFDLVFVGPPYYKNLADRTLEILGKCTSLPDDIVVIAEVFKKDELKTSYGPLQQTDERLYGDNRIHFYATGE